MRARSISAPATRTASAWCAALAPSPAILRARASTSRARAGSASTGTLRPWRTALRATPRPSGRAARPGAMGRVLAIGSDHRIAGRTGPPDATGPGGTAFEINMIHRSARSAPHTFVRCLFYNAGKRSRQQSRRKSPLFASSRSRSRLASTGRSARTAPHRGPIELRTCRYTHCKARRTTSTQAAKLYFNSCSQNRRTSARRSRRSFALARSRATRVATAFFRRPYLRPTDVDLFSFF